jgi:hypothetical protein
VAKLAWNNYINALRVCTCPPIFILITDDMMQSNKVISAFKNKGWKYFKMCQDVMLGTIARGNHTFSAVTSFCRLMVRDMREAVAEVVENLLA